MSMLAIVKVTRAETISSAWRFSKPAEKERKKHKRAVFTFIFAQNLHYTQLCTLYYNIRLPPRWLYAGQLINPITLHMQTGPKCHVGEQCRESSRVLFSPLFSSSVTMAWESKVSFRCSRGVSSTFLTLKVDAGAATWKSSKNTQREKNTVKKNTKRVSLFTKSFKFKLKVWSQQSYK